MRWFFFTTWWRGGRSMPVHSTDESEVIWWRGFQLFPCSLKTINEALLEISSLSPNCSASCNVSIATMPLSWSTLNSQHTLVTCFLAYVGLLAILRRSRRRSQVTEAFKEVFSSLEAHPRGPFGRCYAHWIRSQQNKNKRQWSRWMAFGKEFAELSSKLNCWANAKEMTGQRTPPAKSGFSPPAI